MAKIFVRALLEAATESEDVLVASADERCLGVREVARGAQQVLLEFWFEDDLDSVTSRVTSWPARVREVSEVTESDWMAGARAQAQPLDVGDRFLLDPRDPNDEWSERRGRRWWLRLPARRAFGTGTHETTQLMIRALERVDLQGGSVLDAGSGTGVLSFAALRLGASSAVGFDVDVASTFVGRDNLRLNGFAATEMPHFWCGTTASIATDATFDLVLVNVLPERIAGSEEALARAVGAGGRLLLAGYLTRQRDDVLKRWTRYGLEVGFEMRQQDWELAELV
ncbi:MAG: 50S ribosomal protein L11 methyltransferase, partial [Acidobacteriota bacterium]